MNETWSEETLILGIQCEIFLTWSSARGLSGENGFVSEFEFLTFESVSESALG